MAETKVALHDEQAEGAIGVRAATQAVLLVEELRALGSETTKRTLINHGHGAREPFFGVKVGDMKPIQKRIKTDYHLSFALYDTGISDAMYLAGLIADDPRMTCDDLQRWVEAASWSLLSECTGPWVTAGSLHGWQMALKKIEARGEIGKKRKSAKC